MAEVTTAMVRSCEKTGASMMDCKILVETNGDISCCRLLEEKAFAAAKKAARIAAELVTSYIHMGGRIGVLVEVNCETDSWPRRVC